MNSNAYTVAYTRQLTELLPIIGNSLQSMLQRKVEIQHNISGEKEINALIPQADYPKVCVSFISGTPSNSQKSLFLLQPSFVTQFFAWMIGDEPAQELNDEQLEGLNEALQQVIGQIKMSVVNDQAAFVINDLKIYVAHSVAELQNMLSNADGISCDYTLRWDDKSFLIKHFFWFTAKNKSINSRERKMAEYKENETVLAGEDSTVDVQPVEFGTLAGAGSEYESSRNVDMLLDVDLELSVELDRKTVLVSDLLKLGKGSIVELEKSAGEPLDIFVNGRKFAEGEVVVIDDRFGIRITQLISPRDRVKTLA